MLLLIFMLLKRKAALRAAVAHIWLLQPISFPGVVTLGSIVMRERTTRLLICFTKIWHLLWVG